MASSREFLRSLAGPHVLFAFALGAIQGFLASRREPSPAQVTPPWLTVEGFPIPEWLAGLDGPQGFVLRWLAPIALGCACSAAAILARRLTGNSLVSGCAGALVGLLPTVLAPARGVTPMAAFYRADLPAIFRPWAWAPVGDALATAFGLFAAGVRLLPSPALERAPLFGRREALAVIALLAGAGCGPAILAMPVLILLADLAYSPVGWEPVLRRTGRMVPVFALAVLPAVLFLRKEPGGYRVYHTYEIGVLGWADTIGGPILAIATLLVLVAALIAKGRIRHTLVIALAFAAAWTVCMEILRFCLPESRRFHPSLLALFGVALLIPTILWRISVALTTSRRFALAPEPPLPSVPALRDLLRTSRAPATAPAPAASRKVDPTTGLRSAVETAVAGAVSASLEQIRLAFRGAEKPGPPGTPEQVLWNRLISGSSGGVAPAERREDAIARWNAAFDKEMRTRLKTGSNVLCVGATPWPLVLALAKNQRALVLVERGAQAAQRAAEDLTGTKSVTVVRHDRGLEAVRDASVDSVICLVEPAMQGPAGLLALLKECRRVLKAGGVVGFGHADLALPASQEALTKGSGGESFVNRQTIETLARLAGFGQFDFSPGVLPTTSIVWLRPPKAAS